MTRRTDRVGEALQALVAQLLLREIKDPRIGLVTITGVKISPDLRHAAVYFSTLGDEASARSRCEGLDQRGGLHPLAGRPASSICASRQRLRSNSMPTLEQAEPSVASAQGHAAAGP